MVKNELIALSVQEMRQGLLKRDFSAVELVKAHLERIAETNPVLNSFISVSEQAALIQANSADRTLASIGENSPALTGIPVAIKDMILTQGLETTCASKILKGYIPPYDATTVHRLREAGAVILGKTNLDEFGMGSSNENSSYGPVRNPHHIDYVPGGSSGGSAVAVAAGQAALSLGTDTGGSIRQPAALTGIYGLKPTYGRVSRYGAVAFASSLDQIGPFARTVEDLALIFSVIAGVDPRDSTSVDTEVPAYQNLLKDIKEKQVKNIRIGIPKEFFSTGLNAEIETSVRAALNELKNAGATLVDISLPHSAYALAAYYVLAPAEASSNLARYDGVRYGHRANEAKTLTEMYELSRAQGFGAEVKRRILIGTYVLSSGYFDAYYRKAQQVRTVIIDDFKAAFSNHCDIIAGPVTPTTAFKLGEKTANPLEMYLADIFTVPVNLAGLPGISIPCGKATNGLPIGLQLIAPAFAEQKLFSIAAAVAANVPYDTSLCAVKEFRN